MHENKAHRFRILSTAISARRTRAQCNVHAWGGVIKCFVSLGEGYFLSRAEEYSNIYIYIYIFPLYLRSIHIFSLSSARSHRYAPLTRRERRGHGSRGHQCSSSSTSTSSQQPWLWLWLLLIRPKQKTQRNARIFSVFITIKSTDCNQPC